MNFEQQYFEQEWVWKNYFNNKQEDERVKTTLDMFPEEIESVLDVGCGVGRLTNQINKKLVLGLDFAHTPLTQVKTNPIQASITNLPFNRKFFDLIIITEVLEHLNDLNFQEGIKEIIRMDPDYILVSTPFKEDVTLGLCKCEKCGNIFIPTFHRRSFSTETLQSIFTDYILQKTVYSTFKITPNEKLIRLKQKFGIFSYSKFAACSNCGGSVSKPNTLIYLFFGVINKSTSLFKRIAGIKKPYHQILLFKKREELPK
jgi:2-polyprenyl-3-methyl-5-hydroxy-6-metoxy-1,4-benzoquinol methylase